MTISNKYTIIAILFLVAADVFIVFALINNKGEFVTASFVISSLICVIIGIFSLTFSIGEPVDPRLLGLMPAMGSINFCHISQYLGISGNACFLPRNITGESHVMQFNPVSTYKENERYPKGSFRKTGPAGIVTLPSCHLLIKDLTNRHSLVIPDNEEKLSQLIRETIEDIFKFTPRVSIKWSANSVIVTFEKYPSVYSCEVLAQTSSLCCSMNPCPMCSLCGVLISEGTKKILIFEKCSVSSSSQDVQAVFSVIT